MPQRPLLIFPTRGEASRSNLSGGNQRISSPSAANQYVRLNPKFQVLNDTLNAQRLVLQQNAAGIDPEYVLVFETVGSVEDFANAVCKINGFEWLRETDIEEIIPDEIFYRINRQGENEERNLSGRLYLVMTNVSAMNQLLSLWNRYVQFENQPFERGLNRFKEVFKHLRDIRKWDVQDRFNESNVLTFWEESLQINPDQVIRFEVELWYRRNVDLRRQNLNFIRDLIQSFGGQIISHCDISEIAYQAVLAELPANEIRNIIDHRDTELVKCEGIMFFKPSGQIVVGECLDENIESLVENNAFARPNGNPLIGVLDGYPLVRHQKLDGRLIVEDPDTYEQYYQVNDRVHGTAMCSLIAWGDLNDENTPLSTPLYVRPIMRPRPLDRIEFVPNDQLLIDTIHRVVKQMFEGDIGNPPSAPSVKVINLSIGDSDRPFINSISPFARLLDWLSYKYQVLFIVSAGNWSRNIYTGIPNDQFQALSQSEKETIILKSIFQDSRHRRIISPSESINAITVGALHHDNALLRLYDRRVNPFESLFPATYSAMGSGHRKAIKPDLVYSGGRQMLGFSYTDNQTLIPLANNAPPGHKVAAPDSSLNNSVHSRGTSNAAALMSRNAHFCYEILIDVFEENNLEPDNITLLIKAMLAHGSSWNSIGNEIDTRLELRDWRERKKAKNKLIGYGMPNISKVQECTEQRATVIGFGRLREGNAHIYQLPLPPSLNAQPIKRRLTVTLAWFSSIIPTTQKYRATKLWFKVPNDLVNNRIDSDDKAVMRGTLQHEVFEGENAKAFNDGDTIPIEVNCDKDALSRNEETPYALIVSLEVAEGLAVDLPIYQEIRERISIPVPIGQRV
jgi:hypothetical protein